MKSKQTSAKSHSLQINSRVFSLSTVLLILSCVLLNHVGAKLVLLCELPVFLDAIGTILGAALGGFLPGIVIGFFSNIINAATDPITIYYGMVSVLIAVFAAWFSQKGYFKKPTGALLSVPVFAVIGGIGGSLITWFLYGMNIGEGISAPFALYFCNTLDMPPFISQLIADFAIDLIDKFVTVSIVFCCLTLLSERITASLPLGYIYDDHKYEESPARKARRYRYSVNGKITAIITVAAVVLSMTSLFIGFILFRNVSDDTHKQTAYTATQLMLDTLDAEQITRYSETLKADKAYVETENRLRTIRNAFANVEYMYVLQVRENGCTVIFDLDTEDVSGSALGDRWEIESDFQPQKQKLLAGEKIDPVVSNGQYGWLLTVYQPLKDSNGKTVAYAAADITMGDVYADRYRYIMRMISLLFGTSMIIIAFAIRFVKLKIVTPINLLIGEANRFAFGDKTDDTLAFERIDFKTDDEIEELSEALRKTAQDTRKNLDEIHDKTELITKLQDNIIISFSEMVENRDEMTGGHILRTADYVKAVSEELYREGKYPGILNDAFLSDVYKSAPLHDIGKIKISDAILNKPGKLTAEEFDTMKTHTTEGGKILSQVLRNIEGDNYLSVAIQMAVSHHEKWDGTGYPDGRCGEEIPLCARIMAIADVFDALVSKRSYKKPFPFDEAISIIREGKGGHFDPTVVEAFLHISDQIKEISERNYQQIHL